MIAAVLALAAAASNASVDAASIRNDGTARPIAYDLDLRVDRASKSVDGVEQIEVSKGLSRLLIPLHGQTVTAVSASGGPLPFTTSSDTLAIETGTGPATITIRYSISSPKGMTFTPAVDYTGFDTCTWMICDDRPSIRAPVSMTLHAAAGEWTLASGVLQNVTTASDGTRTFRWKDDRPRSAYLYGFAIGSLRSASVIESGTIVTAVSADVSQRELTGILGHGEGMIDFFQSVAGRTLPGQRYTELIVNGSAAQEKSTFSIIGTDQLAALSSDPTEDWVIAHELAHQFWGNLVTPNTWGDLWLSEGLVTFMTAAWKEHRWGRAAYDREMALARERVHAAIEAGYDKPLAWNGEYPSLRLRRAIAYSRGALFFDFLRRRLGDTSFWSAIKTYTRRFADRSVTSRDLQRSLERSTGTSLTNEFAEWVFGKELQRPSLDRDRK